jgi:hypothetical protein
MDDDVAVDVELGHLLRRHDGGGFAGSGQCLRDAGKGVEAATMAGSLATGR